MVPELFPKQLGHLHEETAGSPNFTAWLKLSHPQRASRAPRSFRQREISVLMEVLTDSTQRQSDSSEKLYLEFSFIKYICMHKYSIHIYTQKRILLEKIMPRN